MIVAVAICMAILPFAPEHSFLEGFLKKTVNSVLLFGLLFLLLKDRIIKFLGDQSAGVKDEIQQKEALIEQKSRDLNDIIERLDRIETEVKRMKNDAQSKGEEEEKRITELGQKEAERIISISETEIERRVQSAVRDLRARVADVTIEHFKNQLNSELNKDLHEKIIEKNIKMSGEIIERK